MFIIYIYIQFIIYMNNSATIYKFIVSSNCFMLICNNHDVNYFYKLLMDFTILILEKNQI